MSGCPCFTSVMLRAYQRPGHTIVAGRTIAVVMTKRRKKRKRENEGELETPGLQVQVN